MNISEHDLLEKYLDTAFPHSKTFINVPVGEIEDWKYKRMKRVTRRRADAVVVKDDMIFLIEAKLEPKPEGIGQLLVYEKLFFDTPRFSDYEGCGIIPIYLVPKADPNIKEVCHKLGIQFEVFTPD